MLRFNRNIAYLGMTLKTCFHELVFCSMAFVIIWIAFVQLMYFIFNKELANINLLEKYFPDTRILLCTFHVIKWFKTLLNTKEIIDGAK